MEDEVARANEEISKGMTIVQQHIVVTRVFWGPPSTGISNGLREILKKYGEDAKFVGKKEVYDE